MDVIDRETYQPFTTALHIIKTVKKMHPQQFQFHVDYFDKIAGTTSLRIAIEKEARTEEIISTYDVQLDEFRKLRKEYFLY